MMEDHEPDGNTQYRIGSLTNYAGETLRLVPAAGGVAEYLDIGTFVFTREPYGPGSPLAARPHADGWQPG